MSTPQNHSYAYQSNCSFSIHCNIYCTVNVKCMTSYVRTSLRCWPISTEFFSVTRKNNGTEHTIKKKKRWATVLVSRGALQKECTGLDEKLSKQCKDTESVADKHDRRKREKNKSWTLKSLTIPRQWCYYVRKSIF